LNDIPGIWNSFPPFGVLGDRPTSVTSATSILRPTNGAKQRERERANRNRERAKVAANPQRERERFNSQRISREGKRARGNDYLYRRKRV